MMGSEEQSNQGFPGYHPGFGCQGDHLWQERTRSEGKDDTQDTRTCFRGQPVESAQGVIEVTQGGVSNSRYHFCQQNSFLSHHKQET